MAKQEKKPGLEQESIEQEPIEAEVVTEAEEPNSLALELQEAQQRIDELTNLVARAHADFENYRRRVQKEKEELTVYANQKLLLHFLPVMDNLERALASPAVPGDEKLREGVELIARSFQEVLEKEGVTPIEAVGQPFDPNVHEAVMTAEDPEKSDGVILAEFLKGYKLGDRVIRASMVQVNKLSGERG